MINVFDLSCCNKWFSLPSVNAADNKQRDKNMTTIKITIDPWVQLYQSHSHLLWLKTLTLNALVSSRCWCWQWRNVDVIDSWESMQWMLWSNKVPWLLISHSLHLHHTLAYVLCLLGFSIEVMVFILSLSYFQSLTLN